MHQRVRRRLGALAALCLCATTLTPPAPVAAAPGDHWILGGDMAGDRLIALDPAVTDWSSPAAVTWRWTPTTALGYSPAEVDAFHGGNDFRLRNRGAGPGQRVVSVDGWGLATVADYGTGRRVWAQIVPGNLHSADLLPDDNVAVAGSTGGFVRVYAASQGPNAAHYAQFDLPDAHAALWDPATTRLWTTGVDPATGEPVLTALVVGGTPAAPTLREDRNRRTVLPTGGGHDVSADSRDPNRLWVTTNAAVYAFDKTTKRFTALPAGNRGGVKAVGNQPSGQLVQTRPNAACTTNPWCTATVDLFGPDTTRTLPGAAFYKARVMDPNYSVPDQSRRGTVWDRGRDSGGAWVAPVRVDGNAAIGDVTATAAPDGTLHVFTLIPGSGVWHRKRAPGGAWDGTATQIDTNATISRFAAAATPDGRVHFFGIVPGSGIWHRSRGAAGAWDASAAKIDENGSLTGLAAAALPDGTLHVFGLLPGSGVWHRSRTPAGAWQDHADRADSNGAITQVAAAGLADGTLHLFGLIPGSGVWHKQRTAAGQWLSGVKIDTNTELISVAATGWPGRELQVASVPPGAGVWSRTRAADGTWPGSTRIDTDTAVLDVYTVGLPDGALHIGTIREIS